MTEVRVALPEKDASTLVAEIADMDLAARANISVVPLEDDTPKPPAEPTFTEAFEAEDGIVELVTKDCLKSFALYEAYAADSNQSMQVKMATYTFNTLARNLPDDTDESYVQKDSYPQNGYIHFYTSGFKAEKIAELVEKLKDGTMGVEGIGDKSIAFLEKFVGAYKEFSEAQAEAVESSMVELGASALSTQRHELQLRLGRA